MKKPLAVIGVLCALVVGFATYNRTPKTEIVATPTLTPEASDTVPAPAGPVTVEFRVSPTFSDEQPAAPPVEQKQ